MSPPRGSVRLKYEGTFEVDGEVKDGRTPREVEAALFAELERLAKTPVDDHELQKVKNQELANSFRRLQSNFFLMLQLLLYDSSGDWHFLNDAPAKVQAVTAADIQRVAAKCFTRENSTAATYTRKSGAAPEDSDLAALPAELRGMVKQQLAQIQQLNDRAKLEQVLARMQQMASQVPPAMKPALGYLTKKVQERLDSMPAAPEKGGGPQPTPPAGAPPKS